MTNSAPVAKDHTCLDAETEPDAAQKSRRRAAHVRGTHLAGLDLPTVAPRRPGSACRRRFMRLLTAVAAASSPPGPAPSACSSSAGADLPSGALPVADSPVPATGHRQSTLDRNTRPVHRADTVGSGT